MCPQQHQQSSSKLLRDGKSGFDEESLESRLIVAFFKSTKLSCVCLGKKSNAHTIGRVKSKKEIPSRATAEMNFHLEPTGFALPNVKVSRTVRNCEFMLKHRRSRWQVTERRHCSRSFGLDRPNPGSDDPSWTGHPGVSELSQATAGANSNVAFIFWRSATGLGRWCCRTGARYQAIPRKRRIGRRIWKVGNMRAKKRP